jgi:hypothetical protein
MRPIYRKQRASNVVLLRVRLLLSQAAELRGACCSSLTTRAGEASSASPGAMGLEEGRCRPGCRRSPLFEGEEGEVQFRSAAYLRRHKFAPNDDAPSS